MDTVEQFKKDVAEDGCGDVGSLLDEIERLRAELAKQQAREKVLREQEPVAWAHPSGGVLQHRCTGLERSTYTIPLIAVPAPPVASDAPKPNNFELAELAASQAREKLLREALIHCSTDEGPEQEWLTHAREVLSIPAADTALREMLARAQEEMRERCVGALRELADRWRAASFHGDADILENNGVEAIRALEVKP